jgi:hypothetical protein
MEKIMNVTDVAKAKTDPLSAAVLALPRGVLQ